MGREVDEVEIERIEGCKQIRPQDLLTFASPEGEMSFPLKLIQR